MNKNVRRLTLAAAVGLAIAGSNAMAEEMEEIVVKGDLGSLPGERVESVFGFEKSILETPRSASTEIGRHTSELQSHHDLVCRLLLEKKNKKNNKKNIKKKNKKITNTTQ